MVSMNNVGSAGGAVHYFSQDNYYTQNENLEHSAWFGLGAERLGLAGKVEPTVFMALLHGRVGDQELGKWVKNEVTGETERDHRPGTDLTFSAPKSVSILAEVYGIESVRAAHEAAVTRALTYLETNLAYARQTEGGATVPVQTGNIIVGLFRHNTSRDLDPQTHTHAVIMNATQRPDGQWRSVMNDELYKAQRALGAIYNAELADQLQALGYALQRSDERGNFEIVGISREQVEHFSQRRAEIEAALNARGIDIKDATAQQKEDATLMTRAGKKDVNHVELIDAWQARAKDVGIDIEAIQARAATALEQGLPHIDRLTGREAAIFAAEHLCEREIVVSKQLLLTTAIEHGAGRVAPGEVQLAIRQLEKEGELISLPDDKMTTKQMMESERWTLEQVRAQQGQTVRVMTAEHVADRVAALERDQGFGFTTGQREALTTALTSSDRYVGVQGLAGTGKTTMLKTLRMLAQEEGYTVRGMAPTGAASRVLTMEAGIASETVSMFQIKERQLQKDIAFAVQYAPDFVRKTELWIVDESSFLAQRQKEQLDLLAQKAGAKIVYLGDALQLQAVEAGKPFELAQQAGMKTAMMSEISRQKTPDMKAAVDILVGRDLQPPDTRLTQVALTNNARAFAYLDRAGMVQEVQDDLIGAVVKDVLALSKDDRATTLVITAYNKDRRTINAGIRKGLQSTGELSSNEATHEILVSKGWTKAMIKEAQYYKPGDVVRFGRDYQMIDAKKGDYMRVVEGDPLTPAIVRLQKEDGSTLAWQPKKWNKVEVYKADILPVAVGDLIRITRNEGAFKNGDIATVVALQGSHATLEHKQSGIVSAHSVDFARNKHWDHAYALTVHASQGVTQRQAIFHIRAPENDNEQKQARALEHMGRVFGDRSFYVGTTRVSHSLRIYTNDKESAARLIMEKQDKTSAVGSVQHVDRQVLERSGRDSLSR